MDAPTDTRQRASLSNYVAAERTFLAWIRTGLALMGFGFVVARSACSATITIPRAHARDFFLRVVALVRHRTHRRRRGRLSSSAWDHFRMIRELNRGELLPARPSLQGIVVALFLAFVGLTMAIYLVSVRAPI